MEKGDLNKKRNRKDEDTESEDDESSQEKPTTKKKTEKKEENNDDIIVSSDEVIVKKLNDYKRVSIRKFQGKTLVDIRDYYNDNGIKKPTKKGISLSVDLWKKLKTYMSAIDEAITSIK